MLIEYAQTPLYGIGTVQSEGQNTEPALPTVAIVTETGLHAANGDTLPDGLQINAAVYMEIVYDQSIELGRVHLTTNDGPLDDALDIPTTSHQMFTFCQGEQVRIDINAPHPYNPNKQAMICTIARHADDESRTKESA
jgi:hypothetical protein